MGTKLEYAINLLAPSSNSTSFNVHCVDDHLEYLQTRGLNNINFQITGVDKYHHHSLNNRMPEKHNIDVIRKTMQMHEDTFKHQVRELHRLYSVQKMLMEEVKMEIKQNKKYWSPMSTSSNIINSHHFLNQQQHNNNNSNNSTTVQTSYQYSINFIQSLRDDPSPRERTSSCSGETMRFTKGFDLERPAEEDISTAGTSSFIRPFKTNNNKMSIDGSDEDSEVELTLSIGGCTNKKISANQELGNRRMKDLDSLASFKLERGEDCSTPTTPMSSSSATFDHERKQPHWLFQGLSINRTN